MAVSIIMDSVILSVMIDNILGVWKFIIDQSGIFVNIISQFNMWRVAY